MNDFCTFVLETLVEVATKFRAKAPKEEGGEDYIPIDYPVLGPSLQKSCAETVRLYWRKGEPGAPASTATTNEKPVSVCVTRDDVERAVQCSFFGELIRHATSEGNKAVSKIVSPNPRQDRSAAGGGGGSDGDINTLLQHSSGLAFYPEQVAMIAHRLNGGFPLTAEAAVYQAGAIEYITAEVLELGSNAATRDNRSTTISSRHIMLAVYNDEELHAMLVRRNKCVFREAGRLPKVLEPVLMHPPLEGAEDDDDGDDDDDGTGKKTPAEEFRDGYSAFEVSLFSKAKRAAEEMGSHFGIFVDPRTGLHMGVTFH
jgi:hypothetical protein